MPLTVTLTLTPSNFSATVQTIIWVACFSTAPPLCFSVFFCRVRWSGTDQILLAWTSITAAALPQLTALPYGSRLQPTHWPSRLCLQLEPSTVFSFSLALATMFFLMSTCFADVPKGFVCNNCEEKPAVFYIICAQPKRGCHKSRFTKPSWYLNWKHLFTNKTWCFIVWRPTGIS